MADDKVPYHERYKAAPPPDYMRYLTAPFSGYWKRQGNLAREGLAMAEDGAKRAREGDLSGYLGQFLGPIAYVSSPINALIPTEQEAYAAFDGDAAPFAAGVLGAASFGLPGPKVKGLGKGLGGLADDVTDAERAALSSRLQAEAGQTGGQSSSATREQALANLTEAPTLSQMGKFDFGPGVSSGSREAKIGDTTVTYGVGRDGLVEVILIKTPKDKRGRGSARAALETMTAEADAAGLRLGLNADPMDKGVSKPKLEDFYKSVGFKRNAGNKRDFTTRLEYLREPKAR